MTKPTDEQQAAAEAQTMAPFSFDLTHGYHRFAELAAAEEHPRFRRAHNAACVVFAAATIEAILNERISLERTIWKDPQRAEFVEALAAVQRSLGLKDKWNLFASVRGNAAWDSAKEPFQSWDIIMSIRNELLHFKGEFLGHLEPPVKRIAPLMARLGVPPELAEEPIVYWLNSVLGSRELGKWVVEKVDYSQMLDLLAAKARTAE